MLSLQVATAVVVLCIGGGALCDRLCLEGDFDSQLQSILSKFELTTRDATRKLAALDDVRNTLSKRWKGVEVIPFGSLVSGLSTNVSDIDIYVRLPNYNISADVYVLEETGKLFEKEPNLYSQLLLRTSRNITIISFYHIPTQTHGDIVYRSSEGVANSKIVGNYFKSDERFKHLVIFLKYWANVHKITGHEGADVIRNYSLYLLTIFYLQQRMMVPAGFELQRDLNMNIADTWFKEFKEIPYSSSNNTESLYQLIGGFYEYYSEFNFEEYIISPFAGRPIHKSEFNDVTTVPEEFSKYKANIKKGIISPLEYNSDICIQDIISHNKNVVSWLRPEGNTKFISHVKSAAKIFKEMPRDLFLSAVLGKNRQNKTSVWNNNSSINQMSKLKDCIDVSIS